MVKSSKILFVILTALLIGCGDAPKPSTHRFSGTSMAMEWRVQIAGEIRNHDEIESIIESCFREVDHIYNSWNPHSEISKLNSLKANVAAPISIELAQFFELIDHFVRLSDYRFDPTINPLQSLWKSKLAKNQVPSKKEIAPLLPLVGWHNFKIENGRFSKKHDGTSFDLRGMYKGVAVDLVADKLIAAGYLNVYIEWGGETRAIGKHANGNPWKVWISNVKEVELHNQGMAMSGDFHQFWVHREANGKEVTYFDMIDPKTGIPLTIEPHSIASVSVLAPNAVTADALATSAMLFPSVEKAEAWAEKVKITDPSIQFWFESRPLEGL